jgi:hypothetical protein
VEFFAFEEIFFSFLLFFFLCPHFILVQGLGCRVQSVVSRTTPLVADSQPGAFDLTFGSSASLFISPVMVGRSYLFVDPTAGRSFKYGQIIVSGKDIYVPVAPPPVRLNVLVGDRVIFVCVNCTDVWISPTNAEYEIAASAGLPFEFGPRSALYSVTFAQAQRFYYAAPTLPGVSGVITIGTPLAPADLLPVRDVDLTCLCNFPPCQPLLPCDANVSVVTPPPSYLPPVPTIPPQQLCPGLTSAQCAQIDGFNNVWGVSQHGSDCGQNDGSVASPFRSIAKAVCSASPGDVVFVDLEGTFYEDMVLWDNCTTCLSLALEDRNYSSDLGRATLRASVFLLFFFFFFLNKPKNKGFWWNCVFAQNDARLERRTS